MAHSRRIILSAFITALAGAVQAQSPSITAPTGLVGSWTVDLRPNPEAAPHLKKLVITANAGGRFDGYFYDGSPIQAGRQKSAQGLKRTSASSLTLGKAPISPLVGECREIAWLA